MTIFLPFEILTAIFEKVDDVQDLCHIRNASRTFCAAATPITFRVLSVTSTKESAQNLGQLFDVPEIAAHVREVAYHDTGTDRTEMIPNLKFVRTSATPELANSFSRIHQLPRLEAINLRFFPVSAQQLDGDVEGRYTLQASILTALAASFSIRAPTGLISLSLHNLRTSGGAVVLPRPFQTVLETLRCFQLSVVWDRTIPRAAYGNTALSNWLKFWRIFFPYVILSPMEQSLTELTLHNDRFCGASSGLCFTGLNFPHLCTLSLREVVFEPSVGIESFILRHAATITRLELIACRLPIDDDDDRFPSPSSPSPPLPPPPPPTLHKEYSLGPSHWGRVWDSFAVKLTALIALHVEERDSDRSHSASVCRYVRPGVLFFYLEFASNTPLNEADAAALRCLHMIVAARSEEMHRKF